MQVGITARHTNLTEALKEYVEERVRRLEHLVDPVASAHVVLAVEKYRQSAEITIQGNGFSFHGTDETDDLYTAVDNAVDKLRRQIEKRKTRNSKGRVRESKLHSEAAKSQPETSEPPEERSFEEDEQVDLTRLSEPPPVVKTTPLSIKPMSVEEATLQLLSRDTSFFVFQNALTEEINVVYLLEDGQIGLIIPNLS
jgi:putative sigma-54 modulation protein